MIICRELGRQARVFKSLAGISASEFGELYEKVQPIWFAYEIKRLSRRERKHAIGGCRVCNCAATLLLYSAFW